MLVEISSGWTRAKLFADQWDKWKGWINREIDAQGRALRILEA
jgi:hypothetical protein